MIKVNLLEDRSLQKKGSDEAAISYADVLKGQERGGMVPATSERTIHPMAKLLIIFIPMLMVFLYEKKMKSDANKIMARLIVDLQNVEEVKRQKQVQLQKSEGILKELNVTRPLLNELKQIDYNRLLAIRAMDSLQDIIPFQVWLKTISLDRTSIDVEGLAVSDNDLTQFQQNMEGSPYYKDILIYNSTEVNMSGSEYVGFKIRANLGVLDGG